MASEEAEGVRAAYERLGELLDPYSGWWAGNIAVAAAWLDLDVAVEALCAKEE